MASLNQAKIINALEALLAQPKEEFLYDFLLAYGTPKATINRLRMGDTQRNAACVAGDVAVPRKLYFRAVAEGVPVSDALEEILSLSLLDQHKIRFVLVTDFVTVAAYDRKVKDNTEFDFADLKLNYEFFLPLTGKYEKAIEHAEHPADVKACEKMGRLYDSICAVNNYGNNDLHTLNVFLTRLLFCFFAEDTGIFPQNNQMTLALKSLTQEDGSDLAHFFERLFMALSLPVDAPKRQQLSATFQKFPFVNGGLFQEHIQIPQFHTRSRRLLLECASMAWSEISPVIFGSMFQAVMDPEQRRNMGAHYTSEKNILKVVRPLFLDELHREFEHILSMKKGKKSALQAFQSRLGSLGFLDPACGCGNFLVVSYREVKELELKVVLALRAEEPARTLALDVKLLSKVRIDQFYGIEIEEFPVEIARVSMWLMEHVMNVKFGEFLGCVIPSIPLHHSAKIVCANALTTPWESVVAQDKLHYIFGNPPFSGARMMSEMQKRHLMDVFGDAHGAGDLDFVAGWFYKAAKFIVHHQNVQAAFVSTNSICQGMQVSLLWKPILSLGIKIDFAYKTFKWDNEAKGNAAVFCVIVGFSSIKNSVPKRLYSGAEILIVGNINPYLVAGETVFIEGRNTPLCDVPNMGIGNKPIDNGNYLFTEREMIEFIEKEPASRKYFRPWVGSKELINGYRRFCLWVGECDDKEIESMPEVKKRVDAVVEYRMKSKSEGTRRIALLPRRFHVENMPDSNFIAVPSVSSERRKYVPIVFMGKQTLISNLALIMRGNLYHFGVLTSAIHMAWMRTVCGRLEMRYRYSASIVYNTFPWPVSTKMQKNRIENLAQDILDIRAMYPDMNLAQMYDPDTMPKPLQETHSALDIAVDGLYQSKPFADDEARLQLLFKLYAQLIAEKTASQAVSEGEFEDE